MLYVKHTCDIVCFGANVPAYVWGCCVLKWLNIKINCVKSYTHNDADIEKKKRHKRRTFNPFFFKCRTTNSMCDIAGWEIKRLLSHPNTVTLSGTRPFSVVIIIILRPSCLRQKCMFVQGLSQSSTYLLSRNGRFYDYTRINI